MNSTNSSLDGRMNANPRFVSLGMVLFLFSTGRHAEAWQIVQGIKNTIDAAGDSGRVYLTSHHYMAGYLYNESGDYKKALGHLEQADKSDPFHTLLLARAYEGSGAIARARQEYERITKMNSNRVERALAYPEAVNKRESLSLSN